VRGRPDRHHLKLKSLFVPVNEREYTSDGEEEDTKSIASKGEDYGGLLPKPKVELMPSFRFPLLLAWKGMRTIGCGLQNMGNTCYLNSVMQCLAYLPPMYNYADTKEHAKSCRRTGFCAMCSLDRLILRMHTMGRNQEISPKMFRKSLRKIAPSMRAGCQEDSHEWLRYLVDCLQDCCLEEQGTGGKKNMSEVCIQTISVSFFFFPVSIFPSSPIYFSSLFLLSTSLLYFSSLLLFSNSLLYFSSLLLFSTSLLYFSSLLLFSTSPFSGRSKHIIHFSLFWGLFEELRLLFFVLLFFSSMRFVS